MYHWSDNPMILSGEYIVILDPQQNLLPINNFGQRLPGVKISLKMMRQLCTDQLSSFEGLFNFKKGQDYYAGTMFRFPFRHPKARSSIVVKHRHVNATTAKLELEKYYSTARMSLLFLRNVNKIELRIRNDTHPLWTVEAQRSTPGIGIEFASSVVITHSHRTEGDVLSKVDTWIKTIKVSISRPDRTYKFN
jgi:sacsin